MGRVRWLREARGWSARQLAERLHELDGGALDRNVIASLESGRRQSVSVDELTLLALALDCSPAHLLVPDDDTRLRVGRFAVNARLAMRWVVGLVPFPGQDVRQWSQWSADYLARVRLARETMQHLTAAYDALSKLAALVGHNVGVDPDDDEAGA
ncbi:hypothetical protein BH20ACT9_BH20ACT9_05990 [soil metagenome]